ncbi:2'-5' RNA ligase family protein [Nocardia bovistercoris]|uniref:2'-5' RNA ligase family protein n=1 Tax=Nocardia bovistercoris TaxID=2785916 RepID=A0A931I9T4_9NOCA|nr:2'-5' RNA ligase family protein [Nocardia bovistercoris]MBH0777369.1 2'-5' RNA ligase family protein [Nocardia bovistercoris]
MRTEPTAIGYLRKDVSGIHQQWDETRIRSHAKRLGYELTKTVTFSNATDDPETRLINVIRALDIDAVVAPSLAHFGGTVPERLIRACELNVLAPEPATYARRYDAIRTGIETAADTFPPAPASISQPETIRANDWTAFRALTELGDHWSAKPWPADRTGYYWYLTFDDPALVELTARCQKSFADTDIAPVPPDGLHLTILGIGDAEQTPATRLPGILGAARVGLARIAPFDLEIGPLTGSRSALRFSVTPWNHLIEIHRVLRAASIGAGGLLRETFDFRPHLGVGYLNSALPAGRMIDEVAGLRDLEPVTVRVEKVELVRVRREGREYRWDTQGDVRLGG